MVDNRISVIVAVYNVDKYLNKCIESIVNQTYQNLEIILVDDGSTDTSAMICDKWAEKDERIKVLHKKNGGVAEARNAGLALVTGRWLGFVDGDDYIKPEMYEQLYMNHVDGGITICGFIIEKSGKFTNCPAIDKCLTSQEAIDLYIDNEVHSLSCGQHTYLGSYSCNKLYDIGLFKGIKYPKGKRYEDMYVILEILRRASYIRIIPDCYYIYIQRKGSITHSAQFVVHDSFYARQSQIEYLQEELGITDPRMETLMICEYFRILYFYSCQSYEERRKNKEIAQQAIESLKKYNLSCFSLPMRIKLLLFTYFPSLFYWLRQIKWSK